MKLLRIKVNHFKNCQEETIIDLVAKSKKTTEDKEYELQEVAEDLYVYSIGAFVGKNASGKTTALELLDCCYDILGKFSLENKHYSYDGIELEIIFYHDGFIYKYETELRSDLTLANRAIFCNQHIYKKKYYKTKLNRLYADDFVELINLGELPEDTANVFFVLKKKQLAAAFYGSNGMGVDTYQTAFYLLKTYQIDDATLAAIVRIFDSSIQSIQMLDRHKYRIVVSGEEKTLSDTDLLYLLSSGTTKGIILYTLVVASLKHGFDLLVDEAEAHFHKTLVENMLSLYMDKTVNTHGATLLFSTHYCEVLDLFNRQDNIWVCQASDKVAIKNMYESFDVRSDLLKSKRFYNNAFQTAVNYDELMNLKRRLMK